MLGDLENRSSSMAESDAGEEATALNSDTTFTVSVIRSKKTGKVLYLEAGKDFVDTLISFLLLPVGTVLHLLSNAPVKKKPLGSISAMFESVGDMDASFLHVDRKYLLEPRPAAIGTCGDAGLLKGLGAAKSYKFLHPLIMECIPKVFYRCSASDCTSISTESGTRCGKCLGFHLNVHTRASILLGSELESLDSMVMKVLSDPDEESRVSATGHGFVREKVTYVVTDCLEIMPSNTFTSMKVLNKLKVVTLADLESSDVSIDIKQVLQILRSALTSSTCLNDVFGMR